jgi:tetratricopeptide (TPR) repeat protein
VFGGIAFCCLSVSPVHALSDSTSSIPALTRADSLHRNGLAALQRNDWTNAVFNFESLQALDPGYRGVEAQRALAWKKLKESRAAENAGLFSSRNRTILRVSLACVALLAIFGIVIAVPHVRACYRLWRGDDDGAAQVYEKILQWHPQRTQFYAPLAELYLLLGRNDAHAIKVYKAVLQLDLARAHRQEIEAHVVQYYLNTDQIDADDDAIPVLEKALKTAYHPRPQSLAVPQNAERPLVPSYA